MKIMTQWMKLAGRMLVVSVCALAVPGFAFAAENAL